MNENPTAQNANEQPNFNGQQPPNFSGQQNQNSGEQSMSFGQQPPTFNGQQNQNSEQPMNFGGPNFGGQQPDGNMWGNAGFANEEIFNGNNFDIGATNDISAITDTAAALPFDFAGQNNFGNFGQGNMMSPPPMFGNQGGQFNQPQQASPQQAE